MKVQSDGIVILYSGKLSLPYWMSFSGIFPVMTISAWDFNLDCLMSLVIVCLILTIRCEYQWAASPWASLAAARISHWMLCCLDYCCPMIGSVIPVIISPRLAMFSYQGSLQVLVSGFGLMVSVIWIRSRSRILGGFWIVWSQPWPGHLCAGVGGNGIIWDIYQCSNWQNCSH